MGDVWIKHEEEFPWSSWNMAAKDRATRSKVVTDETKGPWFLFSEYLPNVTVNPHSHKETEVIYVLEGQISVGETPCPPGTLIFVERDTVYGPLTSGPDGVKFLIIRTGAQTGRGDFQGKDVVRTEAAGSS